MALRNEKGQFIPGNKEGRKFGINGGDTAVNDAISAGIKSGESKRRAKSEAEVFEMLANLPLPKEFSEIHKTLSAFGVTDEDRNFQAAVGVNMYRIALGADKKAAILAASQIHRCRTDGKVDMKVTMEQAKPKPAIVIDDFEGEEGE